jgi:Zn ribbon nucleic-acid-binding protein
VLNINPEDGWVCGYTSDSFEPKFFWYANVFAACPQCQAKMSLGALQGGGAVVHCHSCGHHQNLPDHDADDIALSVLGAIVEQKRKS